MRPRRPSSGRSDRVNRLVVSPSHPEPFLLQRRIVPRHPAATREVRREQAVSLGIATNLVDLTPATMQNVSISIDFLIDKENRLALLAPLINSNAFSAAVSLSPVPLGIARTVGALASQVLGAYLPGREQEPILQFTGDFIIGINQGILPGYYAILGTQDAVNPLPSSFSSLELRDNKLYDSGHEVALARRQGQGWKRAGAAGA